MTFSKEQIIKNFSRHAASYDRYADIQQMAADRLLSELPFNGINSILELGCGTGYYTALLKNKYLPAKITAIDISPEMIKRAKTKLSDKDIAFIIADAEEVNIEGEYDLITGNAVFHWFESAEKIIAHYKSFLRKNGLLAFSSFGPQTFYELRQALCIHFQKDVGFTAGSFVSKSDLAGTMQKHFGSVTITEFFWRKKYDSLLDLLTKIKYTGTNGFGLIEKTIWNKKLLHAIEGVYKKEFGGIEATSHLFICKCMKL